jgi:predicted nucleic acid-binding protein
MRLLDTNLLIRYLTNDDPAKATAVARLLQEVKAGRAQLSTTEVVVAEITFVLSSPRTYNLSNADIAARLSPILRMRGIAIPHKRRVLRALVLFGQNEKLDYSDALLVATAEATGVTTILSYDADFDGVSGITRDEP